ncbi:hypothetical protein Vretimale_15730 [Volvox reticuliferus]|uniref:Uncharacterized protein n=1 Tax=Volvox reticuliferus TaxID=1737510 RepID=A0A8J4GRF6_9CHLO|nr:hypothetical protein Vretifemale_18352 [Volvox reticuliferus]GIM12395.1 hypothetical protein Vretimale_15730 [Volvox reticuliferus]
MPLDFRHADTLVSLGTVSSREVIVHMSDYVPPSEVVRHIIHTYGNQDFGAFRSTLLGLLSSCAYEQAIMSNTQRLISRGSSHHTSTLPMLFRCIIPFPLRQRLALATGCLPRSALRSKPEAEPYASELDAGICEMRGGW